MKTFSATRTALLFAVCLGLTSCDSSSPKARAEAVQFAYSWEQTIKALGLFHMSNLKEVEKQSRHIESERSVLRAEGSDEMRTQAEQLDTLILYFARSLDTNIKVNAARPNADAVGGAIPVDFPDPSLNKLLGLDPKDGDNNPQKGMVALHEAIVRFAVKVGVGSEFKGAIQRREQADATKGANGAPAVEPSWLQVREEKVREVRTKKASLYGERDKVEKEALDAKAPVGFAGAKWLMSPDEVKNIRPKAAMNADGNLMESMEWLTRPATVWYYFDNGFLVMVSISFGRATAADFATTQDFLQSTQAKMSAAQKTDKYVLDSHYTTAITNGHIVRFTISHVLGMPPDSLEMVVYSREDF